MLLDQLVLEAAQIAVLRCQLDLVPGAPGPLDALQRLLQRHLARITEVDAVHPRQGTLDLGDGVAAEHLDGNSRRLRRPDRGVLAPVVVLEGEHHVGIVDVMLDAHRKAELAHRLLQVAA